VTVGSGNGSSVEVDGVGAPVGDGDPLGAEVAGVVAGADGSPLPPGVGVGSAVRVVEGVGLAGGLGGGVARFVGAAGPGTPASYDGTGAGRTNP
jgi:hypothetical protein